MPPRPEPPLRAASVRALREWFRSNRRVLPWREEPRDPYRVWLSEIMLQQTQVDTVIPYFERFLSRWPTVEALAAAPQDAVLEAWSGLGYYARARNLHAAAQQVTEAGGQMPADLDGLQALKGIGRYTAGAIYSLAFGGRAPVLDGNVERVLCRLYAIDGDPKATQTQKRLWALADALLPPEKEGGAGEVNEALMELGALVCTPGAPRCLLCPLKAPCAARAAGLESELPRPRKRARQRKAEFACAVIRRGDEVLAVRRAPEGLLGGLWGLPGLELAKGRAAGRQLLAHLRDELGVEAELGAEIGSVRHVFTHIDMRFVATAATSGADADPALGSRYVDARFVTPAQALALGPSRAMQKVLGLLTSS